MKFCIIDVSNLVHRAKHAIMPAASRGPSYMGYDYDDQPAEDYTGLIMHSVFISLKKAVEKFGADHCVACFDSRSWRREVYEDYKANRRDKKKTDKEEEEHELINNIIDELHDFFHDFTNVTVLKGFGLEADDFVARWVQIHSAEEFHHVIVSADSDFKQLVCENVDLYIPVGKDKKLYTVDGIYIQDGKKPKRTDTVVELYDENWKVQKDRNGDPVKVDPEWDLFVKCIRGDSSDNIKSAWPRVQTKKMKEAFYGDTLAWNNFINSFWGQEGNRQSVRERYEFNKMLIDLTDQPEEVIELMDEIIEESVKIERKQLVGAYFAKFCQKHKLTSLMSQSSNITRILMAPYQL